MMTTSVREIRDADEEEEERKEKLQEAEGEGEDDEDESEDEDFKPDENDVDEEDGDEGEYEEGMECEIADKGGKAAPGGKRKRAAAAPKKAASKKPKKAKRGGGIALSDDEDDRATSAPAASAEAAPPVDPKQAEEDAKKAAADAKKAAADALWAEMSGSSASKKPAPKPAAAGGLDLKSLLAKAGAGGSSGGGKMVTITETMSFAGKDVSVTKQVLAGSKAELAYLEAQKEEKKAAAAMSKGGLSAALAAAMGTGKELQRQMTGAPGGGTSNALAPGLAFTGKLAASMRAPVEAPVATSLAGLLAGIDGKKKMTAMEKSRHDWAGFKDKQDDQTREEMSKFAKDGYLEKQAFLARTDHVQAQVARSNRRKGMGLKD